MRRETHLTCLLEPRDAHIVSDMEIPDAVSWKSLMALNSVVCVKKGLKLVRGEGKRELKPHLAPHFQTADPDQMVRSGTVGFSMIRQALCSKADSGPHGNGETSTRAAGVGNFQRVARNLVVTACFHYLRYVCEKTVFFTSTETRISRIIQKYSLRRG